MNQRHQFLEWLISVKEQEVTSYQNMHNCVTNLTACVCVFSLMEIVTYFLYLFTVGVPILNPTQHIF